MVPLFDPGPIDHPDIPIHISAINTNMCGVVGEVADGIRLHPVCSPKFIGEVMVPAVEKVLIGVDATLTISTGV